MNSKVLMVVALLFAGSVVASPEGNENITLGMKPSFGWFTLNTPEQAKENLFGFLRRKSAPVAATRFARFKEVVLNNKVKTGVAVVATVAVIAAVVIAASAKNEVVATEEEENYFA